MRSTIFGKLLGKGLVEEAVSNEWIGYIANKKSIRNILPYAFLKKTELQIILHSRFRRRLLRS